MMLLTVLPGSVSSRTMPEHLWTIGHSTRRLEDLVAVLAAHEIATLVDVRAYPGSRRHPHFSRQALELSLPAAGLRYVWMGDTLGGRRREPPGASRHSGLRSASFRAYATHMESEAFARGIEDLLALSRSSRTAVMCAEILWWQCHRSFIADAVEALHAVPVLHIQDGRPAAPHRIKVEARVAGGKLVYDSDGGQGQLFGA